MAGPELATLTGTLKRAFYFPQLFSGSSVQDKINIPLTVITTRMLNNEFSIPEPR